MVNFGGSPGDKTKYTSVADEMWFEFPIEEVEQVSYLSVKILNKSQSLQYQVH
jgi:hypothetical protein